MQRVANAFSMARIKNIYIVFYDLQLDSSDHEVKSDFLIADIEFLR